ncbi:hypothetical protein KA005_24705, partial [bacterium]|nr:hypothetical protein [bacterium]
MAKRLTQKQIIEALYKADGILAAAARHLGCTRKTIYNRMKKAPKIAEAYGDAREASLDKTESQLFKNIKAGKESSVFYYLNNMGRKRGYGKPLLIAPTDPTGTKEYGADAR